MTRRQAVLVGIVFIVIAAWLGWIGPQDRDSAAAATVGKHTAVVDVEGIIGVESKASAERLIKGLNRAFKDSNTQGVVIRINSPGGSPVQAGYVNDEIRRLRAKYPNIPVYAVVQDLCASGGYYIAVAADKIFVDKASLVGSIGAALTLGVRRSGVLLSVLNLPFTVPVLIFGARATQQAIQGIDFIPAVQLLGAMAILGITLAPLRSSVRGRRPSQRRP